MSGVDLHEKRVRLERELAELRARTSDRGRLQAEEAKVTAELEATLLLLEESAPGGPSRLDSLKVASPCTVPWDSMRGDDAVRFCGLCEKNVYNLSAMTRVEAEAFLAERGVSACVRLFRRFDGTILTADCPVGVKKKRFHLAVFSVAGTALMAAGAALALGRGEQKTCKAYVVREHAPTTTEATPVPTSTGRPIGHAIAGGIGPRPREMLVKDPGAPAPTVRMSDRGF